MEQTDFINLYVQYLVNEVSELTKNKVLALAKESYKDAELAELRQKMESMEVDSNQARESTMASWKASMEEKDKELENMRQEIAENRRHMNTRENLISSLTNDLSMANTKIDELQAELAAIKAHKVTRRKKPGVATYKE